VPLGPGAIVCPSGQHPNSVVSQLTTTVSVSQSQIPLLSIFGSEIDPISLLVLFLLSFLLGGPSSKIPKALSFQIGSGWNLVVTLSRWRPWRHFTQKSAAIWWVHAQRPLCIAALEQFYPQSLIHCTFIHFIHLYQQQIVQSDVHTSRDTANKNHVVSTYCFSFLLLES